MPRAGQGRYGSEAELAIQARGVNQRGRAPATRHDWVSRKAALSNTAGQGSDRWYRRRLPPRRPCGV